MANFSVMADVPNPVFDSNGNPFSGAVLKAYLPGTTTSTSIAIDEDGASPQASITYNAAGKLEVSGNEILPYIDIKHKWGIFANATDAAANTPFYMGSFDNVPIITTTFIDTLLINDLSQSYTFPTVAAYKTFATAFPVGKNVHLQDRVANFTIISGTGTANALDIISSDQVSQSIDLIVIDEISLTQMGLVADSTGTGVGTDNATLYQRALDLQQTLNLPINQGAGRRRIATALTYTVADADTDTSSGINIFGSGMGKTIIQNDVIGTMLLIEGTVASVFAKGNTLKGFSIIGKGVAGTPDQVAIRHQAAWYTKYEQVRIIENNGTAVQSGDSSVVDPDSTASLTIVFDTCELDENAIGFDNPQNNNSPLVLFLNTSVRNNSQGGIRANSSYIQTKNSSISFNGLTDASNAFGGVDISQQAGSAFSDGYRTKGFIIDTTELDTNYPWNVRCLQAENPEIRNCSTQFRDYSGIDWAGNGITTFPDAQFIFGGGGANEKCFEAMFNNNRVSIVANGNLAVNPTGHSIAAIGINGVGTNIKNIDFNLDFTGSGSSLGDKFHIISEPQKSAFDNRKYYVEYDYPKANFGTADILNGFTQCFFKKVFPSFASQNGEGMHFAFSLADDTAVQIPLPQLASDVTAGTNYNHIAVTSGGTANAIVAMRCAGGPFSAIISSGPGIIESSTGTPTGTTGVDTKITVFADTDGTCWIENRAGSTINCQASFLLAPGIVNQLT